MVNKMIEHIVLFCTTILSDKCFKLQVTIFDTVFATKTDSEHEEKSKRKAMINIKRTK
jgi:hypothetical protein